VKTIPHRHHAAGKRKIHRRLDRPVTAPSPVPVFAASNIHYEAAVKTQYRLTSHNYRLSKGFLQGRKVAMLGSFLLPV
jgi:hypothetical protein